MGKVELRRSLLQKRQSFSRQKWQQSSQQLCEQLLKSPLFQQAETILGYFSFRQEPDLSSLFTFKTWGFPRCVERTLAWHHFPSTFPLQTGAYGITEPHPDSPIVSVEQVDLILVPCVACDLRGYRLGYGGGFYDRLLSSPTWANKSTIGIAFEFALLSELVIDPWDRPLQRICTEAGLREIETTT